MYKGKLFKVIGGLVAVIFFITSSASAAPLASTVPSESSLRPSSEFNTGRTDLVDSLNHQDESDKTKLSLQDPSIELVPEGVLLAAKFAMRLLKYSRNENARRIREKIVAYIAKESDDFIKSLTGRPFDEKSADKVTEGALAVLAKMARITNIETKIAEIVRRSVTDSALAGNRLAQKWVRDYGTEKGKAIAGIITAYKGIGESVEKIDICSFGVDPAFGIGAAIPRIRDLLLETIRDVAKQELIKTHKIKPAEAEKFVNGIVRSEANPAGKDSAKPVGTKAKSSSAGMAKVMDNIFTDLASGNPEARIGAVERFKSVFPGFAKLIDAYYESLPVSALHLLPVIRDRKAPIPAFNLDIGGVAELQIATFLKAALDMNAPLLTETGPGALLTYASDMKQLPELISRAALKLARFRGKAPVTIAHLDHNQITKIKVDKYVKLDKKGREEALQEPIKRAFQALDDGFTSIALDLSTLMLLEEEDVWKRLEHVIYATAKVYWPVAERAKELGIRVSIEIEVGDIGKKISTTEEALALYIGTLDMLTKLAKEAKIPAKKRDPYIKELLATAKIIYLAAQLGSSHGYDINEYDMLVPYEGGVITEAQYEQGHKGYVVKRAKEIVERFGADLGIEIWIAYHGFSGFPIKVVPRLINTGAGKVNINTDTQAELWKVLQAWFPELYKELFIEAYKAAQKKDAKLFKNIHQLDADPEKAFQKARKHPNSLIDVRNRIIYGKGGCPGARKLFRGEKGHELLRKIIRALKRKDVKKRILRDMFYKMRLVVTDDPENGLTALEALGRLGYKRIVDLYEALGLRDSADLIKGIDRVRELRLQQWQLKELREKIAEATIKSSSAGKDRTAAVAMDEELATGEMDRILRIEFHFKDKFDDMPDVVTVAGGRDNHQGEHVDYPKVQFTGENPAHLYSMGGALQNTYIVAASKRDDSWIKITHNESGKGKVFKIKVSSLKRWQKIAEKERDNKVSVDSRKIPVWANHTFGVLMQAQEAGHKLTGMNILLSSTVPHGAGLSNSAANCCAVAMALDHLYLWSLSKLDIALLAQNGEHDDYVGGSCGLLDQLLSLHSRAGYLTMIDYADNSIRHFKSNLPKTLQRVLVDTNIPHELAATEYNDRVRELSLAFEILGKALNQEINSTSFTLAELNYLIGILDSSIPEVTLKEAGLREINDEEKRIEETMDISSPELHQILETIASDYNIPDLKRHQGLDNNKLEDKKKSFAILLRRMRHQLTSYLRTPLTGQAAEKGNYIVFGELIDAEGRSLRMSGDFEITGDNSAQDTLLDIGFAVAKELGITVYGRMEGGGGGGNVGFYVDRSKESKYQQWRQETAKRYKNWAEEQAAFKGKYITATFIEPILAEGAYIARDRKVNLLTKEYAEKLRIVSLFLQRDIVEMIHKAGSGHPGGSLSMIDILTALYFGGMLRYDPADAAPSPMQRWVNRDRFVLSKGHAAPGLYAALAESGFFPRSVLDELRQLEALLQGHSDEHTPGVDHPAGSLGVAFSTAVGMAIAAKMDNRDFTVFSMLGGGEIQEGQVTATAEHAASLGLLDNLIAFADFNNAQIDTRETDVNITDQPAKWRAMGWNVIEIDGHDIMDIIFAIEQAKIMKNGRPTLIFAKTIKGHGLPGHHAHGAAPSNEDYQAAMESIRQQLRVLGVDIDNQTAIDKIMDDLLEEVRLSAEEKKRIDAYNTANVERRRKQLQEIAQEAKPPAPYDINKPVATRNAGGDAALSVGIADLDLIGGSADLGNSTQIRNKFGRAFGEFSADNILGRYINFGIKEDAMFSESVGLATCGKIVDIRTFAVFITRMIDQIRAVTKANIPMIIVGTHVGAATGPDGWSHQDDASLAQLAAMENIYIYEAADAEEAVVLYKLAYERAKTSGGVHIIRLARPKTPILDKPQGWQEGARKGFYQIYSSLPKDSQKGPDITLVTTGVVTADAVKAARDLAEIGINISVVDITQIKQMLSSEENRKKLVELLRGCDNFITVADARKEILEKQLHTVLGKSFRFLPRPINIEALGIEDFTESGDPKDLYEKYGYDARSITIKALRMYLLDYWKVPTLEVMREDLKHLRKAKALLKKLINEQRQHYMDRLNKRLDIPAKEMQEIISTFRRDMRLALSGKVSSLSILPEPTSKALSDEGIFISIDINGGRKQVIVDASNFTGLRTTIYDRRLDTAWDNPGKQMLEKMVSAKYQSEVIRLILSDLISRGLLFDGKTKPRIGAPYGLVTIYAEYMDRIIGDNSTSLRSTSAFLKMLGTEDSTIEERRIIKQICGLVLKRAIKVSTPILTSALLWRDPDLSGSAVVIGGSFIKEHPARLASIEGAFRIICGDVLGDKKKASHINFLKDDFKMTGPPATLAAIIASSGQIKSYKSSSAGEELMDKLISLENGFIDRLSTPDKAATLTDEVFKQYEAKLTGILAEVSELATKAGISRPLQNEIETKLSIQRKLIELAKLFGNTIKQAVEGDIIIDTSIIKNAAEREVIESIFSNETIKGALEKALSKDAAQAFARVLLYKDLAKTTLAEDRPIILISNDKGKLSHLLKQAKLLDVGEDLSALAVPYHLGVAATLLSLDMQENKAPLLSKLDSLSIQLRGQNLPDDIKRQLEDGTWEVFAFIITQLPKAEAADLIETDRRVRAAVASLIAA